MENKKEIRKPTFVTEMEVKSRPEIKIISLKGKGEPLENFDSKAEELHLFLHQKGIEPAGPTLGVFYRDRREVGVDNVIWDAAVPVSEEIPVEGEIKFQTLEPAQISAVTLTGGYDLIGPALKYMEAVLQKQQLEWSWPLTEIYHTEGETPVTELQYFIQKS